MNESKRPETSTDKPIDARSPMAQAMGIASELISISLEMALIPLGGYWLDRKFEMAPLFLLLGCLLGFSLGFYHLVRFTSSIKHKK